MTSEVEFESDTKPENNTVTESTDVLELESDVETGVVYDPKSDESVEFESFT
jgi:hypothetical protein